LIPNRYLNLVIDERFIEIDNKLQYNSY
jgi:hypothetical protein